MKQFKYKSRQEYLDTQIVRSQSKFSYCKVFFADIFRYRELLQYDLANRGEDRQIQSILCLGVRSGGEVDMFRSAFLSPLMRIPWVQRQVVREDRGKIGVEKIKLANKYRFGTGGQRSDGRVIGVEVNPDAAREDVYVGSFDAMPAEWSGKFNLLYSNSFDHSQDPYKTVEEWKRVAAPGAYVILAFSTEEDPSFTDPLKGLSVAALKELWGSELVFATETMNLNHYYEVCFRL